MAMEPIALVVMSKLDVQYGGTNTHNPINLRVNLRN